MLCLPQSPPLLPLLQIILAYYITEGHVLVAFSDIIGQDAVDPDVTVSGSHLDHSSAPTHILRGKEEVVIQA